MTIAPQINSYTYDYDNNYYSTLLSYTIITADSVEIEVSRVGGYIKMYPFAVSFGNYDLTFNKVKSETTHNIRARAIYQGVYSDWTSYFSVAIPAYPTSLPTNYDPLYKPQVLHQWVWNVANNTWSGQAGNCVATQIASIKEIHEKRERGISYLSYSTGWAFGNRLLTDPDNQSDLGMKIGPALDKLQTEGIPDWELLPENSLRGYPDNYYYNDNVVGTYNSTPVAVGGRTLVTNNKYTTSITDDAIKQKITSWSQYDSNDWLGEQNGFGKNVIEEIKQRVIDDGAVLISMGITHGFDRLVQGSKDSEDNIDYISTGYIPDDVGTIRGYHSVSIIGWKVVSGRTWWIVHNNWDIIFGDSIDAGRAYMPIEWDYIANFYLIRDYVIPVDFAWSTTFVSGQPVNILASDWNLLTQKINSTRINNGLSTINFTTVVSGVTPINATIFNEALSGFVGLTYDGTLPTSKSTNDQIYLSYFTILRDCINSVV